MKSILSILLLSVMPLIGMAQTPTQPAKVYISTSKMAKKYHKTKSCVSLKQDQHRLKAITVAQAKKLGRMPCKNCYGAAEIVPDSVFVCSGSSSEKYHAASTCRALASCKGTLKKMPVAEATQAKKTPCKICIKE
ncbi:MAG: hypothetical protein IJM81_09045 [Prevotella sp.]|nr:hypothetical protein [Prevotella sp.]